MLRCLIFSRFTLAVNAAGCQVLNAKLYIARLRPCVSPVMPQGEETPVDEQSGVAEKTKKHRHSRVTEPWIPDEHLQPSTNIYGPSTKKISLDFLKATIQAFLLADDIDGALSMTERKPWRHGRRDIDVVNMFLFKYAEMKNSTALLEALNKALQFEAKPNLATIGAMLCCSSCGSDDAISDELCRKALELADEHDLDLSSILLAYPFSMSEEDKIRKMLNILKPDLKLSFHPEDLAYSYPLVDHLNQAGSSSTIHSVEVRDPEQHELLMRAFQQQLAIENAGQVTVPSVAFRTDEVLSKRKMRRMKKSRKRLETLESEWKRDIGKAFQKKYSWLERKKSLLSVALKPFLSIMDEDVYVNLLLREALNLLQTSPDYSVALPGIRFRIARNLMGAAVLHYKLHRGIDKKVTEIYSRYLSYCDDNNNNNNSKLTHRECWHRAAADVGLSSHITVPFYSWPEPILAALGRFLLDIILRNCKIPHFMTKSTKYGSWMKPADPAPSVDVDKEEVAAGDVSEEEKKSPEAKKQTRKRIPAFYITSTLRTEFMLEEVRVSPQLARYIAEDTTPPEVTFPATVPPMITQPIPWLDQKSGCFLLRDADLVRMPFATAGMVQDHVNSVPAKQLFPVLDGLSQAGTVAWKINKPILDLMLGIFQSRGNPKLGIPRLIRIRPADVPQFGPNMTSKEKADIYRRRHYMRKEAAESYSLWCSCLYRLSLAHHLRNSVVYLPTNIDFRGRTYPVPPYFSHVGDDLARGILIFAEGKPLGPNGLNWLKLHCINLTGLKKRDSIDERLEYADEVLPKILDSATNPMRGTRWWMASEEPWQTLACCMEIKAALELPDPADYVSHLPVHQDGSCNGFQHYAALGRDSDGAHHVNLASSDRPQDVYAGVVERVEEKRKERVLRIAKERDKDDGTEGQTFDKDIAELLEGFVQRKVLKQTIMTVVYGVTHYGAKAQIGRQLKDLDFPRDKISFAAHYLTSLTFASLGDIFGSVVGLKVWLSQCARYIAGQRKQCISWTTPLGLPAIQPYLRPISPPERPDSVPKPEKSDDAGDVDEGVTEPGQTQTDAQPDDGWDWKQKKLKRAARLGQKVVDARKQKTAFPPNYIHSLDSTHMKLTALECFRHGIMFASVHDCFWTHAATVDEMNQICREQFIKLHQEPLLETLQEQLQASLPDDPNPSDVIDDMEMEDDRCDPGEGNEKRTKRRKKEKIQGFPPIPERGDFDIKEVLESKYFFS